MELALVIGGGVLVGLAYALITIVVSYRRGKRKD